MSILSKRVKIKRIPLGERVLPSYTRGEEIANMVTHIAGAVLGVVILLACVVISAGKRDVWGIVAGTVYGLSMIGLFTVSSVYHGMKPGTPKKVMQAIDHCTIYLLIAGTYTPILLAGIRPVHPVLAWSLFAAQWGLTALAITLTAIDLKKYAVFSMFCYLMMGWMIIIAVKPTIEAITLPGALWVLYGGIAYTVGAVLYGVGKKRKYFHTIFHVFVNLGCILQAIGILWYVL